MLEPRSCESKHLFSGHAALAKAQSLALQGLLQGAQLSILSAEGQVLSRKSSQALIQPCQFFCSPATAASVKV